MVIPLPREDCLRVTHPCATLLGVAPFLVRLACVKRAANVRSEPGSNSPVKTVSIDPDGRNHQRISFGCQLRRAGETRPFANGLCLRFSFQRPITVRRPGPENLPERPAQSREIVLWSTPARSKAGFSGVSLAGSFSAVGGAIYTWWDGRQALLRRLGVRPAVRAKNGRNLGIDGGRQAGIGSVQTRSPG